MKVDVKKLEILEIAQIQNFQKQMNKIIIISNGINARIGALETGKIEISDY